MVADEIRQLADNSKQTAGHIRSISEEVVKNVQTLAENAKKLLSFVHERVLDDYDVLESTGKEYFESAERMDSILQELEESMTRVLVQVSAVSRANGEISITVGESAKGVTEVAGNTSDLSQDLKKIAEAMQGVNGVIGQLKGNVEHFVKYWFLLVYFPSFFCYNCFHTLKKAGKGREERGACMRSEKEMMDLIIGVAERDERIRGVYLNGSRANPNAPKDIFQDYDFVYVVKETPSFIRDKNWIDVFGERLYMQLPEEMGRMLGQDCAPDECYGYLIQLSDGNRIDFHLQIPAYAWEEMRQDRMCRILLDKDGNLPKLPPATDEDHWVKRPSAEEYRCCCNEFWWLLNNIGKGLWRGEIPYAMDMINMHERPELLRMLSWYAGLGCDFSCSVGKSGKYLYKYLSQNRYERLLGTYPAANVEAVWNAMFSMCDLFDETARRVGQALGYEYDEEEAHNSRLFFDCTCELPGDAAQMLMVRRMRKRDVDRVVEIWRETNLAAHSFVASSWFKSYEPQLKDRLLESEVYVYEDHRGILGFAGIENGYLEGIFVRQDAQSQGIGGALMSICKTKYFKIRLHVFCKNERAVDFYMRQGFQISKKRVSEETGQQEYEMLWRKE